MQFYIVGLALECPSSVSNAVTSASESGDIVSKYDAPKAARTTNIDKTIWKELKLFWAFVVSRTGLSVRDSESSSI